MLLKYQDDIARIEKSQTKAMLDEVKRRSRRGGMISLRTRTVVMPGLDPGIHAVTMVMMIATVTEWICRVKPGNDDKWGSLSHRKWTRAEAISTDSGGKIADNIVYFARALRKAGLPVGPASVIDADPRGGDGRHRARARISTGPFTRCS